MNSSTKETDVNHDKFNEAIIWLHWIMLILIFVIYATIEFRVYFEKGSASREYIKSLHFMFGLSVLAMAIVRLVIRTCSQTPAIVPEPPLWQKFLSGLAHVALYVLMIGMPLLGWLTLSALGKPVPFFGLDLPALIEVNKPLGKQLEHLHAFIGEGGYYLIGLHAMAALFHHYVIKDNTLSRMSIK